MAILPEHPGLEVKICVRGQQLHEYDDDDKDAAPNTITKYIEARSGKEFSIVAEYRPPFPDHHDVLARVCIDGVGMTWIRKRDELFQDEWFRTYRSYQGGKRVKQKFTFAKLNISKYYEDLLISSTYGLCSRRG